MKASLRKGDITKVEVDAIVNAANTLLLGGGGVDGAIHRAGGKEIMDECIEIRNTQGGCKVGEAVITTAGKLKAKKVIHTVGPVWKGGDSHEQEKLRNCYINSLQIAEKNKLKTICFPNISTGVYGFPKEEAAKIAIEAIMMVESKHIEEVIFICFDETNYNLYDVALKKK
ncbi:MAG TPA: O-acetyl-ADP-ribose deacetylase [Flavobacteriales bacterium]|nr:O-acetyl-ADP-ribose deacetylase [Flavobacteriales bacterium]HIN39609.1 O-acetyl-ADP-ribose deacetylase [Flavobacteriales bacterium]